MAVAEQLSDLPFADYLTPHDGPLEQGSEHDTCLFDSVTFEDAEVGNVRFLECAFTAVTFTAGQFRRARFNEVWLRGARVVGTELIESVWLDSPVVSSALSGVEAYGAELRRVVFSGCKLDSVNLRAAELDDVSFENCVLTDVDLAEARLTKVRFAGSELRGVRVRQATMDRVDFRGATAMQIAEGYESLRGAIVDRGQLFELAPGLAATLGIAVED
jgi:uncharacterized protein YjbI with pentapeptide repeats